jgi:hypothetical protein
VPSLETIARSVSDALPALGNANGAIDPGETIAVDLELEHLSGPPATGVVATLMSTTPGVTVIEPMARFPDLLAGDRAKSLNSLFVRVDKQIACGTSIELTEIIEANGGLFTNTFREVVGRVGVTNLALSDFESDGPAAIPDRGTTVSQVTVPAVGTLTDVGVAVRIEHPWHGDLHIELEHPDGTRVTLVGASGNSGADFGSGPCGEDGGRTEFDDEGTEPIQGGSWRASRQREPGG